MQKKIIVLAGYAPSLINFRLHLLKEFQKKGYQVIASAPQNFQWVREKLKSINIPFYHFPLSPASINPIQDLLFIKKYVSFLNKQKPDIVFAYTIKPVIYGSISAKLAGIPAVYSLITGLGYTFEQKSSKQKLIGLISTKLYSFALRSNKTIFFQNSDDVDVFKRKKILGENANIAIINGSGVDLDYFQFETFFPEKPVFLLIARILKSKGILEYIAAAKIVKNKYPQARFHLVGYFYDSPDAIDKKVIMAAHEEGIIDYKGETDDVRPYIRNCSVYVLPSYREGTPRTVLEAMAMGRPIITTNVPGCKETVIHNENGFLVENKNSEDLASAMTKFINNPKLLKQMGRQSRVIAEQKYDVNKVNKNIISAMEL